MSPVLQVLTFLTGILCAISLSAGIYGFIWGARLGEDALAGVTQPPSSSSPVQRSGAAQPSPVPDNPLEQGFLSENAILERVKTKTSGVAVSPDPDKATDQPAPSPSPGNTGLAPGFPHTTQSQGVSLEVHAVAVEGEVVNLKVFLRNESTQTVRFLYSFLSITDNRGRSLSSSVQGLPGELPSMSQNFEGEIRIPKLLLKDVTSLTIALADYPDQTVKLKLEAIPINLEEKKSTGESKSI